ncbi:MAG TPA: hypothetical protein VEM15_11565, partial [Thermodesulfobacteriota bacterium]|nr:hypothetical protein [Thermodesulfobacteriota bacterium]
IGEANPNARRDKGSNHAFRSSHVLLSFRGSFLLMKKIYPFCEEVSMVRSSWNIISNHKEYPILLPIVSEV